MESINVLEGISLLAQISVKRKELDAFLCSKSKVQDGGFADLFNGMSKTNQQKYYDMLIHSGFVKDPKPIISMIKK